MSTFLQLVQDYAEMCDLGGGAASITSVLDQTGEKLRAVNNIIRSWRRIQRRHTNWRWMRHGFTLTTVASTDQYAYNNAAIVDDETATQIARFARWRVDDPNDPPKIYLTSGGVGQQGWLVYADWDWFKRVYRIGTQNPGQPAHITIDPLNRLVLGPVPSDIYTINGDFQLGAQVLAADGDVPEMPADFHDLIVFEAMNHYGFFEAAPEAIEHARIYGGILMRQLETDQLPMLELGEPMASENW